MAGGHKSEIPMDLQSFQLIYLRITTSPAFETRLKVPQLLWVFVQNAHP